MQPSISRRRFIHNVTLGAAGLGAILGIGAPVGLRGFLTGA